MTKTYPNAKTSLGRCLNSGKDPFGRFYEIFLASHPSISPMFTNTDMKAQKALLQNGINLAIMFAEGDVVGQGGVSRIRASHSKKKMAIDPALYPYWLNSFVQAIAEIDPKFSPELEKEWRELLQVTVDHIVAGFDK